MRLAHSHAFIQQGNICILSIYYVPGAVPGSGDSAINQSLLSQNEKEGAGRRVWRRKQKPG